MNNSALNEDIEKDVLPWLRLAEDLRVLQLDVEVPQIVRSPLTRYSLLTFPCKLFPTAKNAPDLRYG